MIFRSVIKKRIGKIMIIINNSACSQCFSTLEPDSKCYVHNGWLYCDYECFNEGVKNDMTYAWLVFKNATDIYNGEELLGSMTLTKEHM